MSRTNMQILLASRPTDGVQESNFCLVANELPSPGDGEIVVKNQYLSLDPYMRGRMNATKSYASLVALGEVMVGETVGIVVESQNPQFQVHDTVRGSLGWQQYAISDGSNLTKVMVTEHLPASVYLGAVGMPGVTAWVGLFEIGKPQSGETVVISAASGAVGSIAGQLAKSKGCRVVGIAGGKAKCDYVVDELGFDACIDYKAGNLVEELAQATPDGIDVYFENVGGEILEAVLGRVNTFARIPLCGLISRYSESQPVGLRNLTSLLFNRVTLQGFIVGDYADAWPAITRQLGQMITAGQLKYHETIAEGLEHAPAAFIGMLKGQNLGKQLVKLA
jgi:NADPH-dependent curcumin reductase CurA